MLSESRTTTHRHVTHATPRRHAVPAAALTLIAGLVITAFAVQQTRTSIMNVAQQRFKRLTDHTLDEITRRANLPVYGLRGARGVYAASVSVERREFTAYVASRNLPKEFPGVLGMGLIVPVERQNLATYLDAQRADDGENFDVLPFPGTHSTEPLLYVVQHICPLDANRPVWGLDVGAEPTRRTALERAIALGEPTITSAVTLPQDPLHRNGYLYLVPVYRNDSHPTTPEQRRAAITGIVFAPVVIEQALAGIVEQVDGMLDFGIVDGDTTLADRRLYGRSDNAAAALPEVPSELEYGNGTLAEVSTVVVGGHVWLVQLRSTPKFWNATDTSGPWFAGFGGMSLSAMLAMMVWAMGRSRAKAVTLAEAMTASFKAAQLLAEQKTLQVDASAAVLRRTGDMAHVGGWELDLVTHQVTWTDEVYRIHQLPIGSPMTLELAMSFYPPETARMLNTVVDRAVAEGVPYDIELPLRTATGKEIFIRAQGECFRDGDQPLKLCGAVQDITERKAAELQLRKTATHDKLTGLPNRALLTDRLQQSMADYLIDHARAFAVLFMDFDRFKLTNDTLGHDAGDDLLRQIADRLRDCLRPAESSHKTSAGVTVARLGGDEFVVVLDDVGHLEDATLIADRLLRSLAQPYRILGHEVVSTASIGIVISDPHYARAEDMLRDADIAMYEAKFAGKGRYIVFDAAMYQRVQRRMQMESELRAALGGEAFTLVYQPLVSLEDGSMEGVEALLRWNHPTRGPIDTAELISVADECGLIVPIGEWVIRHACENFREWQSTLGSRAPRRLNVNISRKQLALKTFPDQVAAILRETGVAPDALHLEVTETAVMKDPALARQLLTRLKETGVRVDMDDFGTGHSSLAMLHELPIDVLKIDRTFIKNLSSGREFAAIVQAISQLARNLGIEVVAEGIEHPDQLAMLQTLDCTLGQGFLLGRPMTAAELCVRLTETTDGLDRNAA